MNPLTAFGPVRRLRLPLLTVAAFAVAVVVTLLTATGDVRSSKLQLISASTSSSTTKPVAVLEGSGNHLRWNPDTVTVQAIELAGLCQVSQGPDQQIELVNHTRKAVSLSTGLVLSPDQPIFVGCFEHPGTQSWSLYGDRDVKLKVVVTGKGIGGPATVSGRLVVTSGSVGRFEDMGGTVVLNGLPYLEMIHVTANGTFSFSIPQGTYDLLAYTPRSPVTCGARSINAHPRQHISIVLVCRDAAS